MKKGKVKFKEVEELKIILWDFQGTLAYNEYMFSKVLYRVMSNENKKKVSLQQFKDMRLNGFPWQKPDIKYEPAMWWDNAEKIFNQIYLDLRIKEKEAMEYSKKIRKELLKGNDFNLYPDSIEILKYFNNIGYQNIILSNHIPELNSIVEKLELDKYILECITSGEIGYEKPNQNIFKYVLDKYKETCSGIWMVGDSILADIRGAQSMGIKAILVRTLKSDDIVYYSEDLYGLKKIIKEM